MRYTKSMIGKRGVVAAGDRHSAWAGAQVLKAGGNAVDACIASTLAACVAEPPLTGLYGGGFATVADASGNTECYDFFAAIPGEVAASHQTRGDLDFWGLEVDFGSAKQVFHIGRGAVAVPLMARGLHALHEARGKLNKASVVQSAQTLAKQGVPTSAKLAPINAILGSILKQSEDSRRYFAPKGDVLRAGESFYNPEFPTYLDAWAQGDFKTIEEPLLKHFAPPYGLIKAEDMGAHTLTARPPLAVELGPYQVLLNPPPSSGGLLVAFGLRLFENINVSRLQDLNSCYPLLFSAMVVSTHARAHLDRALVGERFSPKELGRRFLSDGFVDAWRDSFEKVAIEGLSALRVSELPPEVTLGSTTHVSCVDAQGMACAITTSNGEGCGHMVPGTGSMANNFLGEADLHPGGFHSQRPQSRLTSMMCPTVVLKDGKPHLSLGTGGSNRIRTALLQVLVHHLLAGRALNEAVQMPRLHYEGGPLYFESSNGEHHLDTTLIDRLQGLISECNRFDAGNMFFGGVHSAGQSVGAGDARRGGHVEYIDA